MWDPQVCEFLWWIVWDLEIIYEFVVIMWGWNYNIGSVGFFGWKPCEVLVQESVSIQNIVIDTLNECMGMYVSCKVRIRMECGEQYVWKLLFPVKTISCMYHDVWMMKWECWNCFLCHLCYCSFFFLIFPFWMIYAYDA